MPLNSHGEMGIHLDVRSTVHIWWWDFASCDVIRMLWIRFTFRWRQCTTSSWSKPLGWVHPNSWSSNSCEISQFWVVKSQFSSASLPIFCVFFITTDAKKTPFSREVLQFPPFFSEFVHLGCDANGIVWRRPGQVTSGSLRQNWCCQAGARNGDDIMGV